MKYSKDQLSRMAKVVVKDREAGGNKSFQLIMSISLRTGLRPAEIMRNISQFV